MTVLLGAIVSVGIVGMHDIQSAGEQIVQDRIEKIRLVQVMGVAARERVEVRVDRDRPVGAVRRGRRAEEAPVVRAREVDRSSERERVVDVHRVRRSECDAAGTFAGR